MTSVYKHSSGGWYCSVVLLCGKRKQIYLGQVTKAQAEAIGANIAHLRLSLARGVDPSPRVQTWCDNIDLAWHSKLVSLGLIRSERSPYTVDSWCTEYLAKRVDYAPLTVRNWKAAQKVIVAKLGNKLLTEITIGDAKQMARTLLHECGAVSHASKLVSRTKQLFQAAVDAKLLQSNPFDAVSIAGGKGDQSRRNYVSNEVAKTVLQSCIGFEAKAVFALARWCGLRVPSEPLALRWSDIDWEHKRLIVPKGTKTGQRIIPLFPQALKALEDLYDSLGDAPAEYVFNEYRPSANKTWRDRLEAAIKSAGVVQWPKIWVNLRASCRTDLQDRFTDHVCDAWLGHSSAVAKDHYLLVTPEHWERAKEES